MSGPAYKYLYDHLRTDLLGLVEAAKLTLTSKQSTNKKTISEALERHLRDNQSSFENNPIFADFFAITRNETATPGAPTSTGTAKPDAKTPVKRRKSVAAKKAPEDKDAGSEPDNENTLKANVAPIPAALPSNKTKTPVRNASSPPSNSTKSVAKSVSNLNPRTPSARVVNDIVDSVKEIPISPAVLTDAVVAQQRRVSDFATRVLAKTGVQKLIERVRDQMSTSSAVTTFLTAVEALLLFPVLLPLKYLGFVTPEFLLLGIPAYSLRAPQVFNLVELQFWSTIFLWSAVSIILPAVVAYFVNIPLKAKHPSTKSGQGRFDPFAFNAAKCALIYLVFVGQMGLPAEALRESRTLIENDVPFGHYWLLGSSIMGGAIALYEKCLY